MNVGVYPVTVAMYRHYCSLNSKTMPQAPSFGWLEDHPMVNISWHNIQDYCAWIKSYYQDIVRLPYDREWTFIARGGLDPAIAFYPWGDSYIDGSSWTSVKSRRFSTISVTRTYNTHLNGYGVLDASGNVAEWLQDSKDGRKCFATGSWYSAEQTYGMCKSRTSQTPLFKDDWLGFRLVTINT
jgi:formylglycine-generating enzyme required for sulfatase activity